MPGYTITAYRTCKIPLESLLSLFYSLPMTTMTANNSSKALAQSIVRDLTQDILDKSKDRHKLMRDLEKGSDPLKLAASREIIKLESALMLAISCLRKLGGQE